MSLKSLHNPRRIRDVYDCTATVLFVAARVLAVDVVGLHLGTGAQDHFVLDVTFVVDGFYCEHHLLVTTVVAGV